MYHAARFTPRFSLDRVGEDPPAYGGGAEASSAVEVAPSPTPTPSDALAGTGLAGQALRLAMALVQGADVASSDRAAKAAALRESSYRAGGAPPIPLDGAGLVKRLHRLARSGDRLLAEQLRLLPAFEASGPWRVAGCRDCVAWLDRELGISRIQAFERLRVARAFAELPVLESLFATGRLSWSKVRELTRVADAKCEAELVAAALDLSVSETIELCRRWRHREDGDGGQGADAAEAAAAMRAFEQRALTWRQVQPGKVRITLDLPTDLAAEWSKANECSEDELREDDAEARNRVDESAPENDLLPHRRSARQYRADAALLTGSKALAHRGEAVSKADRYRVLINLDARVLEPDAEAAPVAPGELPPERPTIPGFGPISIAAARRIAASAGLTVVATAPNGEVVGVGASTRRWPPKLDRAIRARDRHCQMPGCTATRWTHNHHVVPVCEGGLTTAEDGTLLCSQCHPAVHEGGFRLERVSMEDLDLGADAEALHLTDEQVARAKGFVSRVQRFRLIGPDGRVVAGPKRRFFSPGEQVAAA